MRHRLVISISIALIAMLACNIDAVAPRIEQPPQPSSASAAAPNLVATLALTSTSAPVPSTTATPSATRSPEPTSTTTPTYTSVPTSTPTPTNTTVPTLPPPDFDQLLTFGGGGGDPPCLYVPDKSLPAVEGSTTFGGYYGARQGILCIWGAPFDIPLDIYLTSPNWQTVLKGTAEVESATGKVKWQGKEITDLSGGAANLRGTTAMYLSLWWPAQLEPGTWQVQVLWPGDGVFGSFTAKTGNTPQMSMLDPRFGSQLLAGRCHQAADVNNLAVVGVGFPSDTTVFVLVYANAGRASQWKLMSSQSTRTDRMGSLVSSLGRNFGPGQYTVVGVWDPRTDLAETNGALRSEAVADAVDCFTIPGPTRISSCPGAPLQRMSVNQRGRVCTQGDTVRLRAGPARSASTILELRPNTQFTVIGGPSCADNWSWWQARLDDGTIGWIAEGGDETDPYFICPQP